MANEDTFSMEDSLAYDFEGLLPVMDRYFPNCTGLNLLVGLTFSLIGGDVVAEEDKQNENNINNHTVKKCSAKILISLATCVIFGFINIWKPTYFN